MRIRRKTANENVESVLDDKHVLNELDASQTGKPSIRRYHYGTKVLAVTENGGTPVYILNDGIGSASDFWSASGMLAKSRQYDAWGNFRNGTAPAAGEAKVAYTGHQYDPETGWVYAKARYYDSGLGVFLSRDSYEGDIGNGPSLHRYMYAFGNPLRWVDLYGYCNGSVEDPCNIGQGSGWDWVPTLSAGEGGLMALTGGTYSLYKVATDPNWARAVEKVPLAGPMVRGMVQPVVGLATGSDPWTETPVCGEDGCMGDPQATYSEGRAHWATMRELDPYREGYAKQQLFNSVTMLMGAAEASLAPKIVVEAPAGAGAGKGVLFDNLRGDAPKPVQTARLEVRNGQYVTVDDAGATATPKGRHIFVTTKEGEIKVAPLAGDPKHVDLSGGQPVSYAGEIKFDPSLPVGEQTWSNASGHFMPTQARGSQAGLPMEAFRPVREGGFFEAQVGRPWTAAELAQVAGAEPGTSSVLPDWLLPGTGMSIPSGQ